MLLSVNNFLKLLNNYFDKECDNYILWLPIFFIIGIICRFQIDYYSYKILSIFILTIVLFFANREYYYFRLVNIIVIFILCGYIRTHYFIKNYDFYTVKYPIGNVKVYGKVEKEIINRDFNDNYNKELIVKVNKIEKNDKTIKNIPNKLKIRLKDENEVVYINDIVLKTFVFPIQNKYFQSDFDFRKYMYFQGIGGVGYKGKILFNEKNNNDISIKQKIDIFRAKLAKNIIKCRESTKSTTIISVLLTGQKNLANKQSMEYMNYSGLAHLLSISGLHMMTLIVLIMFVVKWILLRFEYIALNYNVFKISAIVSLIINFVYLLLSGSSISAIRSYIMSVILLISIIIGRFNSPLRSIMFVMFTISFVKPHFIFNAGFQMSFMAVIGLTSCIEYYYNYKNNRDETVITRLFSGKITQYFLIGFITSLVAELATTPFSIYNFNNYSFYNIFANSFLAPLVSFLILPLGLFSLILYFFNLEYLTIVPASYIMDFVLYVSKFITEIPNAVMFVKSPNLISMFFMIFGFLWFCLWKEKWRNFGVILYIIGLIIIPFQKKLDVVVNNVDKMIVFVDKKEAYIYSSKNYKINKILKKLGISKYYSINDNINTKCNKDNCTKIIKNKDTLIFIKDGKIAKINTSTFEVITNFNLNIGNITYDNFIKNY